MIVGEQKTDTKGEEQNYRKIMHNDRDGRHLNKKIEPNPDKKDPKPMYVAKRVRHDSKDNFSNWTYPWEIPPTKKGSK